MRVITNIAVGTAISAGVLMSLTGQATAETPSAASPVAGATGSSSGSASTGLNALLCALQGGVTASTETAPPACHLPTN